MAEGKDYSIEDYKKALKKCYRAMVRAEEEGVADHFDCCEDGGDFWYTARHKAGKMLGYKGKE